MLMRFFSEVFFFQNGEFFFLAVSSKNRDYEMAMKKKVQNEIERVMQEEIAAESMARR